MENWLFEARQRKLGVDGRLAIGWRIRDSDSGKFLENQDDVDVFVGLELRSV